MAEVVKARRKWKRTQNAKIAATNELNKLRREAILNVLEIIDFGVTTEVEPLRKVLPLLQDYLDRGDRLLNDGKGRELKHEIGINN